MNILRSVEVALIMLSAFGTDLLTDFEVFERGILVVARVAELARREETVYEHDLCAIITYLVLT